MLSIDEVKTIDFRKANLGGYRPEEVKAFQDDVIATLEQNRRDKVDLVKKLDILAKRIEEYRKDEESVRGALINAEKVKETAMQEAQESADKIIQEAQAKAKEIIYNANASIVEQKNNYLKLKADAVVLRQTLLETYNSHIRMLEDLPTAEDIGKKKAELDQKYTVSEYTETATKPKAEDENKGEQLVDISTETAETPKAEEENPAENKFENLEFGEDYNTAQK